MNLLLLAALFILLSPGESFESFFVLDLDPDLDPGPCYQRCHDLRMSSSVSDLSSSPVVCGDDGTTYVDACEAGCGGRRVTCNTACPCHQDSSSTAFLDLCRPCLNLSFRPVCDVHGRTFRTACQARCEGGIVDCPGQCPCGGQEGGEQGEDLCPCPDVFQPVCGYDGRDYGNACTAKCRNVGIACGTRCPCVASVVGDHPVLEAVVGESKPAGPVIQLSQHQQQQQQQPQPQFANPLPSPSSQNPHPNSQPSQQPASHETLQANSPPLPVNSPIMLQQQPLTPTTPTSFGQSPSSPSTPDAKQQQLLNPLQVGVVPSPPTPPNALTLLQILSPPTQVVNSAAQTGSPLPSQPSNPTLSQVQDQAMSTSVVTQSLDSQLPKQNQPTPQDATSSSSPASQDPQMTNQSSQLVIQQASQSQLVSLQTNQSSLLVSQQTDESSQVAIQQANESSQLVSQQTQQINVSFLPVNPPSPPPQMPPPSPASSTDLTVLQQVSSASQVGVPPPQVSGPALQQQQTMDPPSQINSAGQPASPLTPQSSNPQQNETAVDSKSTQPSDSHQTQQQPPQDANSPSLPPSPNSQFMNQQNQQANLTSPPADSSSPPPSLSSSATQTASQSQSVSAQSATDVTSQQQQLASNASQVDVPSAPTQLGGPSLLQILSPPTQLMNSAGQAGSPSPFQPSNAILSQQQPLQDANTSSLPSSQDSPLTNQSLQPPVSQQDKSSSLPVNPPSPPPQMPPRPASDSQLPQQQHQQPQDANSSSSSLPPSQISQPASQQTGQANAPPPAPSLPMSAPNLSPQQQQLLSNPAATPTPTPDQSSQPASPSAPSVTNILVQQQVSNTLDVGVFSPSPPPNFVGTTTVQQNSLGLTASPLSSSQEASNQPQNPSLTLQVTNQLSVGAV